jgi:peptidoglycan hydrolase-like protein with peptidoglycan-binding domain
MHMIQTFTRVLQFQLPFDRGFDVLALQSQLIACNTKPGTPDGIFGPQTRDAVLAFQTARNLPATGICDQATWNQLFPAAPAAAGDALAATIVRLGQPHFRYPGGVSWALQPGGVSINGAPPAGSGGAPVTITRIWNTFGPSITKWGEQLGVPAELIMATIAIESNGKPDAIRFEPKYQSDATTPGQVSPGLMQTLIQTAQSVMPGVAVDRNWLFNPDNSIQAGTRYILQQSRLTGFDPPAAACAYNAGGVYEQDGPANRWRMRQFPIGTGDYCDRYIPWFNDAMTVLRGEANPPKHAFVSLLPQPAAAVAQDQPATVAAQ